MGREFPGSPHEVLLVLDATTGQNAVNQAKMFNEAVGVTGLVLTKLDGTAKGGIIIRLAKEFDIPIRYIGIGEKMDDLRVFNSTEFVDALME
jgi:fused signal recognition particle receptor